MSADEGGAPRSAACSAYERSSSLTRVQTTTATNGRASVMCPTICAGMSRWNGVVKSTRYVNTTPSATCGSAIPASSAPRTTRHARPSRCASASPERRPERDRDQHRHRREGEAVQERSAELRVVEDVAVRLERPSRVRERPAAERGTDRDDDGHQRPSEVPPGERGEHARPAHRAMMPRLPPADRCPFTRGRRFC